MFSPAQSKSFHPFSIRDVIHVSKHLRPFTSLLLQARKAGDGLGTRLTSLRAQVKVHNAYACCWERLLATVRIWMSLCTAIQWGQRSILIVTLHCGTVSGYTLPLHSSVSSRKKMFGGRDVVASPSQNSLIPQKRPTVLIQLVNIKGGACFSRSVTCYGWSLSLGHEYEYICNQKVLCYGITYDVMI